MMRLTLIILLIPFVVKSQQIVMPENNLSFYGGINVSNLNTFVNPYRPYLVENELYDENNIPLFDPEDESDFTIKSRVEKNYLRPGAQLGIRYSSCREWVGTIIQVGFSKQNLNYDYYRKWFMGNSVTMEKASWSNYWLDIGILLKFELGKRNRIKCLSGLSVAHFLKGRNYGWMKHHLYYTYMTNSGTYTINNRNEYEGETEITNINYQLSLGLEIPLTRNDELPLYGSVLWNRGFSNLSYSHNVTQSSIQFNIIYYLIKK